MTGFLRDVRFGLRLLARNPVFTATSALLLAIGISANTLIFSVVDALLLRELPVARPHELVRLVVIHPTNFVTWELDYELYEALAAKRSSFSEVLCQGNADVGLVDGTSTERVRISLVSPNFYSSLGVGAHLGRADTTGAVLSYDFWQRRFRGDPAVLGRGLILNGHAFVVIGVLPRGFNGLSPDTSPDIRVPVTADRLLTEIDAEERRVGVEIFGRLRSGFTLEKAEAEARVLLRAADKEGLKRRQARNQAVQRDFLETNYRLEDAGRGISTLRTQFSRGLVMLMAGVGLLLLMACANVAGLLLARSAVRAQEMSVRLALGANPWRVARQLLTESLLLAVIGGIAGMLLTYACLPLLTGALPPIRDRLAVLQPLAVRIDIDWRVLAFAIAATLATAVLFGISPALQGARVDLSTALRASRTGTRRLSAQKLAVAAQVAVCTLLLVGAALLIKTLERMRAMDPGFDRDHVVTFTIDPRMRGYKPERAERLSLDLLDRTRELPGMAAASIAGRALMRGTGVKATFGAEGTRISANDFLNTSVNQVMPGYFDTMGIRLVTGRNFIPSDDPRQKPSKVIVNQAFARRFFPGADPIGKRFGPTGPSGLAVGSWEVIGVVTDAKYRSLREEIPPTLYGPAFRGFGYGPFVLHVRTLQQPEAMIGPVRNVLRSLDPELPFVEVKTLREEVETSLWQERLLAALSSIFGAIAALLATIGLYGALDFAVKTRGREIGVRIALGAEPIRIARLLLREILLLVVGGVALGLGFYAMSARWIRQALYEVQTTDPAAIGSALVLVAVIAILAAAPPVCRAIRIDPATALRQE
ncbi:MAG: ABC transporter permease [Bryobacteraceae bacterium]